MLLLQFSTYRLIFANFPQVLYTISWAETAALFGATVLGLFGYSFLHKHKHYRLMQILLLYFSAIFFLFAVSGLWLQLFQKPALHGNIIITSLRSFYSHPAGFAIGSIALVLIKSTVVLLPLVLLVATFYLHRKKAHYVKRCSHCNRIFPPNTKPHQSCPYCGAYWKYEKE